MYEGVQAAYYLNDQVMLNVVIERTGNWLFHSEDDLVAVSPQAPDTSSLSGDSLQVGSYPAEHQVSMVWVRLLLHSRASCFASTSAHSCCVWSSAANSSTLPYRTQRSTKRTAACMQAGQPPVGDCAGPGCSSCTLVARCYQEIPHEAP